MPSAEMCSMTSNEGSNFSISSKEIEGLVLEIKENLRLSAGSTTIQYKAISRNNYSRKSSRASPYSRPVKCCERAYGHCGPNCLRMNKRKPQQEMASEDPYELLQKLLRDGGLVNEAVKRVQGGFTTKQQFYYDSDDDCRSPVFRIVPHEN